MGNIEKRYVGSTDEPLCEVGICEVNARKQRIWVMCEENGSFRMPKKVYVSPLRRCRQTAELLFPDAVQEVIPELCEMDFGEFEYKNYEELASDVRYQAFIDSGGCLDFPGAEPQVQFRRRIQKAFRRCLEENEAFMAGLETAKPQEPLVFVVHGGTIMAIMEAYARPRRSYFEWQVGAVSGYRCKCVCEDEDIYLENIIRL